MIILPFLRLRARMHTHTHEHTHTHTVISLCVRMPAHTYTRKRRTIVLLLRMLDNRLHLYTHLRHAWLNSQSYVHAYSPMHTRKLQSACYGPCLCLGEQKQVTKHSLYPQAYTTYAHRLPQTYVHWHAQICALMHPGFSSHTAQINTTIEERCLL